MPSNLPGPFHSFTSYSFHHSFFELGLDTRFTILNPIAAMKFSVILLTAVAQVASAHYFFDSTVIDGAASEPFTYIRDFTRETKYNPIKFSSNPAEDIRDNSFVDSDDIRCNQGAFEASSNTDILEVGAGGDVTVKLGVGGRMEHPGPSLFYMSRAPGDDVKAYDGSGDWFKIGEEGVCNQGADFTSDAWCSWAKDTLTATIPAGTPDGEYLLRFEHIGEWDLRSSASCYLYCY